MKEYIVQANAEETIATFDRNNAPELVRCRDCKHGFIFYEGFMVACNQYDRFYHKPDWFCADGVAR